MKTNPLRSAVPWKRLPLLLLSLQLVLAGPLAPEAAELTVLHINDSHGHLWAEKGKGGFDVLTRLVGEIDEEVSRRGGHVLFLHGGDVNTGVPESDLQHGLPDLALLRLMGCDAMVLGNHEFDNPQALLRFQESFARFPFLSANFVDSRGRRPFEPYRLFDFGDLTVAVLGLTTEETAKAAPFNLEGGRFEDVIETARAFVPELDAQADVVIALGHLGWDLPRADGTGSRELAEAGIEGLDIIIDGHSHTLFDKALQIGSALVAQAGSEGRWLGRFDLTVEEGKIVAWNWQALPLEPSTAGDPHTASRLRYYRWQGSRKTGAVIGSAAEDLDGARSRVRSGETNLSRLIADAFREMAVADLALINGGGIRDSIATGPISLRDALAVLPFGNDLVTLDLSGDEVALLLDALVTIPPGAGAFPHLSGVRCRFSGGKASDIFVGDSPLDGSRTYRLATINYLAEGGDGYDIFLPWKGRIVDTGYKDIDAFAAYVRRHSPLKGTAEPMRIVRE